MSESNGTAARDSDDWVQLSGGALAAVLVGAAAALLVLAYVIHQKGFTRKNARKMDHGFSGGVVQLSASGGSRA